MQKWIYLWVSIAYVSFGQVARDSKKPSLFPFQEFLEIVAKNHPSAQRAFLKEKEGEALVRRGLGFFDPLLSGGYDQKTFDGKNYYQVLSTELRVPTPIGLDVVGGFTNTEGEFLNPMLNTTNQGLYFLGLELDVLQGLLVNERRVAQRQSQISRSQTLVQQSIMLQKLLLKAASTYFIWQQYTASVETLRTNISLAEQYRFNVVQSYENGEKTAVDTLEATILLQERQAEFLKYEMLLQKVEMVISNFLWTDSGEPAILGEGSVPEELGAFVLHSSRAVQDTFPSNHPLLLELKNEIALRTWDLKLKREKLKPKLKLKYQPLLATAAESLAPEYDRTDLAWGAKLAFPLFLRKERGEVQLGTLKVQDLEWKLAEKELQLENKLSNLLANQENYKNQWQLQTENSRGYQRLYEAEQIKFQLGESSVFLVNKRQEKWIEVQLKAYDAAAKYYTEIAQYLWYSNQDLQTF